MIDVTRRGRNRLSRLARTGDDVRHIRCVSCGVSSREGLCRECRDRTCRGCGRIVGGENGRGTPDDDGGLCQRCRADRDGEDRRGYPLEREIWPGKRRKSGPVRVP